MYIVQFKATLTANPIIIGFTENFQHFLLEFFFSRPGNFVDIHMDDALCVVRNSLTHQRQLFEAIPIKEGICPYHWISSIEFVKVIHETAQFYKRKYKWLPRILN